MRLRSQTGAITCPDEQGQMPDFDSALTDFDVLEMIIEQTHKEVDDKVDTKVLDLESHETPRGFLDWTEIANTLEEQFMVQYLEPRNPRLPVRELMFDSSRMQIFISGCYLPQAQSDFVIIEEKEKQTDRTETAYIEKISQVDVSEKVESIFRAVAEEVELEGEIEDEFTNSLSELIGQYEGNAVIEIQHLILKEEIPPESAEATLRILGDLDHKPTYNYRRWLIEKALIEGSLAIVRNGASVGLSYMDDPHTIPFLKKAISKEENPLLRKVMDKTLSQLEDTQKCLCFCGIQNTKSG